MSIEQLKVRLRAGPGRLRTAGAMTVGLGLLVGTVYAGAPAEASGTLGNGGDRSAAEHAKGGSATAGDGDLAGELAELESRVARVKGAWAELAEYYDAEVAPIERVLLRYEEDTTLVRRISVALVREAHAVGLEPRLLLAVLLVENPWLERAARSPVGAVGLMQVMPVHRGAWGDCGTDLEDIDANICHGAHIFAHYFERSRGDLDRALLRYNGCVNGTNTPDCHQYPNHVFANAGRASVMTWMSGP
ncbi:MAG: transglycosylase SLT domain-containing protein [Gemmatimonadota bacterium]